MPERPASYQLGRYVIRRRLGAGGFARVYLGFDPDIDFEVAIKVLKPQFADDGEAVDRFRREATTAVRLRHPNVVTVLTVGRVDEPFDGSPPGTPYLVMDYLPDSLADRLAGGQPLPEPEILRIGVDVARGLAYAHAAGVVHRDIKPDNVLFGRDGQAVVTDFGIARALADGLAPATRSVVVGTPSYFSPEQARGLRLDGRADIYALGVTLYQACTGGLPFTGDDWYAVMRQHVEDPPVPPRERNPALSPALDAVILRCLAKDPADRFASADALAEALLATRTAGRARSPADAVPTVAVRPHDAPAPRAGTRAASRTASRPPGRRAGTGWMVAGGLAGSLLAGTAIVSVYRGMADDVGPLPGPTGPGATTLASADSVASLTAPPLDGLTDSVVEPPGRATLRVFAPAGTRLSLNGAALPLRGASWSDTLQPGRYEVRAAVPPSGGCEAADTVLTVDLAANQQRAVRITPPVCGTLTLLVTPTPARFALVPIAGGVPREGTLPLSEPLVLAEGTYRLTVAAPRCATYTDEQLTISAARGARQERVTLLCD